MKFGNFETKNHIFMAPVKTALATPKTGFITDEQIAYYERKAKGGVGTIILEPIAVLPSGKEHPKQTMLNTDEHITGLKKLTNVLHKHETKLIVHLNHAGKLQTQKHQVKFYHHHQSNALLQVKFQKNYQNMK
ncbi:NADH:flavin oxidoreductase / NADH oxidase family protein [Marinitoga hydrogenitolerans DSM 16785]|uniref:NADH:flavin oxidoreductase / NADH oxidase family protein n=1 Tax=Marinitoga hydrogenitolerans (strain DSM 16785 / JCM 12826 / AT1271) TaxID=1122195 RepID=A0A1M4ZLM8_MARH1|nr:hypothetical protein [Marinitoga hydrogenitolerans]SHF18697.1 NADH:flavin oxidoreductase / NADH oxidase family protein [Marinitoga hydrogenitolerans DSM 16785]